MKNKIRIMNTKPEISDAEIQSYMNFDRLLRQTTQARADKKRRVMKSLGFTVLMGAGILALWYWRLPVDKTEPSKSLQTESKNDVPSSVQAVNVDTSSSSLTETLKTEVQTKHTPSEVTEKKSADRRPGQLKKAQTEETTQEETSPLEKGPLAFSQAEPVDGYPALYAYFNESISYPAEAIPDSIEGMVTVVFSINANGAPENISIEQSLGTLFDEEAVRVVKHMPAWRPATYNGKPVSTRISLPLTFRIKNNP